MFQTGIAGNTINTAIKPNTYVNPVSVSGFVHALRIVGKQAKASPTRSKMMAVPEEFIVSHTMIATADKNPHARSKNESFQYP